MGTTVRTAIGTRTGVDDTRWLIPLHLLLMVACGTPAIADINFSPIVSLGAIYSDNVSLAPPGFEQDDALLEITPGFLLEGEERRFHVYTEYGAQALFYSENSEANEVFHQADVDASWKIVPERFSLDVSGSHGQQVVDPEQPFSFGNISLTGNRTDATAYSFGPSVSIPFANALALDAFARHFEVSYNNESLIDAWGNDGRIRFGTFQSTGGFAWEVSGQGERVEYDVGPEIEYQQAAARIRLGSPSLAFLGLAGMESDYETPSEGSLEDEFWEAAVAWNGSDYAVEAGVGERSFGETYRLSISAEGNSFAASIDYSEQPSTPARVQLERREFSGNEADESVDRPGRPERFIRKLFQAEIEFPLTDGSLALSALWEDRDQRTSLEDSESLPDESLTTFSVNWNRELGLRTAVSVNGSWGRRNFGDDPDEDDIFDIGANFIYRFGRRSTIVLRYGWSERDSGGVETRNDYTESQVSVYFTWTTGATGTRSGAGRPRRSFN